MSESEELTQPQAQDGRLQHLFDQNFDPVVLTTAGGVITGVNQEAAQFFAQDAAELIGRPIDALHADGAELPHLQAMPPGVDMSFSSTALVRPTGKGEMLQCPVNVRVQLIGEGEDRVCQWIYHDLSNQLALEQLRQDLIVMLVHDLKSPLSNVISSLDLITPAIQKSRHDPELLLLLDLAARSSHQLKRLIDSLLDIRRLEAGQPVGRLMPVYIQKLAENAYEIEQPNLERRGIVVRQELPDSLPPVFVDEGMMERVLLNLIDNALKYSGGGQTITIAAEEIDGGQLLMQVSDEGKGVPPEHRERIFDKYERIQGDTSGKGLGLGLAFCRLAVEAHGGRIWVDDAPGGGARFNVTMRTVQPHDTPSSLLIPPHIHRPDQA